MNSATAFFGTDGKTLLMKNNVLLVIEPCKKLKPAGSPTGETLFPYGICLFSPHRYVRRYLHQPPLVVETLSANKIWCSSGNKDLKLV